ncbi:Hydrogenase-4 component B [Candidatus Methylobacter favarea]|uniref:Hydrogenase-4 component B n=1 Tax=Candidatus Methylobacter favarea TaxID=2707345 RepID=A0A8S0Y9P6_9GAMM|nr:hydrogenase 4 subunit B [Candidatus Methylobacter favarea]CAA9890461.1 Hydrogenase-4 component B [Candidatus Methylobacter favarea]
MIIVLAYCAVLLSLASGFVALLMNQRSILLKFSRSWFKKYPPGDAQYARLINSNLKERRFSHLLRLAVFALLGLSGLFAILAGISVLISKEIITDQIGLGLPWLSWHVRFDSLSGFFFLIVGIAVGAVGFYGPGYVHAYAEKQHPFAALGLFTGLFVSGMLLVLLADDAFFFMIAWELMSVASYFLVAFQHENPANRRAAFLYLLMAEVGALAIILSFGVLASFTDGFTFDALREAKLSTTWASIAFALALLGFGMKAGIVPVHVWLPEAHPVAPSHISALMSGVMLKIALYGLIRFCFDLLAEVLWQWGVVLLIAGTVSALGGILYALMQTNLKRLLAYSSVENIGIIFMVMGLTMIFMANGQPQLAALGFLAALLHAFNHALFKNLLFLGAGIIQHQTHELNIDMMGGLIKRMPQTSMLFLIGCMSISGLPLFNGFVSEWLSFQTALQVDVLDNGVLRSLIPVAAAALALTAALASACFVKVFGMMFLGRSRSRNSDKAHEVKDKGMLAGPGLLAGLCFLFGIFPGVIISLINDVAAQLLGQALPNDSALGWLWLAPVSAEHASYSPPLVLIGALIAVGISVWYLQRNPATVMRRAEPWDCGFGGLTPRMQYNCNAFSMPIRRIFAKVWIIDEQIDKDMQGAMNQNTAAIRYQLQVQDHSWPRLYQPIEHGVNKLAKLVGRIQTGNIRVYLGYSFVTLIIMLWVIS